MGGTVQYPILYGMIAEKVIREPKKKASVFLLQLKNNSTPAAFSAPHSGIHVDVHASHSGTQVTSSLPTRSVTTPWSTFSPRDVPLVSAHRVRLLFTPRSSFVFTRGDALKKKVFCFRVESGRSPFVVDMTPYVGRSGITLGEFGP